MTGFSRKAMDEVPQKHDDQGPRRTKPADVGPPSVEQFHRIYNEGRQRLSMGSKSDTAQQNQFKEDRHGKGYHNDVPLTGDRSWLRGAGRGGEDRPTFDRGKLDPSSKPPKPASGLKASGQDMPRSPFSAAHKTYSED